MFTQLFAERGESERQDIELDLLYGGDDSRATCDPDNADCRATARAIAREVSEWRATRLNQLTYEIYGRHYDRTMSAVEIDAALRFLDMPAGRAFGAAQRSIWKALMRPEDGVAMRAIKNGSPYEAAPRIAFDRRTAHLPRRKPDSRPLMTAPPAPLPLPRPPASRTPAPPAPPAPQAPPGGAAQPD